MKHSKTGTYTAIIGIAALMLAVCACDAAPEVSYSQAYLDEAKRLNDAHEADQFALVDIDADGVPELAASSSEGSWDKDQIFLYTVKDGKASLLASDIAPGMEGHYIGFYEGENIVEKSGAAFGEIHEYYSINEGGLSPVLSLQWLEDPERDYELVYLVDGQESDEAEYSKAEQDFLSSHANLTYLDTNEMAVMEVSSADGMRDTSVVSTKPYLSYDELAEQLK